MGAWGKHFGPGFFGLNPSFLDWLWHLACNQTVLLQRLSVFPVPWHFVFLLHRIRVHSSDLHCLFLPHTPVRCSWKLISIISWFKTEAQAYYTAEKGQKSQVLIHGLLSNNYEPWTRCIKKICLNGFVEMLKKPNENGLFHPAVTGAHPNR